MCACVNVVKLSPPAAVVDALLHMRLYCTPVNASDMDISHTYGSRWLAAASAVCVKACTMAGMRVLQLPQRFLCTQCVGM